MIVASLIEAMRALPSLRFPVLAIGMVRDGEPYAVCIARNGDSFKEAAHAILSGTPWSHIVVTSLSGDDPRAPDGR